MKCSQIFRISFALFLMVPALVCAETVVAKKNPKLEEMTSAELKAALKKSHDEISSRLGSDGVGSETSDKEALSESLSDKQSYITAAQGQIDLLTYKIRSLELNKTRKSAKSDAMRLRDIKSKAQDQLNKVRSNNTLGWKADKQALDNLLRDGSYY